MIRQSEDKNGFWGTTILIVLFFAFIGCFAHNAQVPAERAYSFDSVSTLHTRAIAINDVQQVYIHKSLIAFCEATKFNQYDPTSRIMAFDRLISHKITFLLTFAISIKPTTDYWFFNRFHLPDDDFPPLLS